jgi:hypothetical protein
MFRQMLTPLLIATLIAPPFSYAQTAPPAKPPRTFPTLQVIALAGDGETNDIEKKLMAPLVVQVLDINSRPVEGAEVTFRFPLGGPSAAFGDGQLSRTVRTNADGQAAAAGWTVNNEVGPIRVRVTASRGTETGETVITMINGTTRARPKKDEPKRWYQTGWFKALLIGGIAGGVTAGILATRSSTPTITVTPGNPSLGGLGP